jgi:hypothetical protein
MAVPPKNADYTVYTALQTPGSSETINSVAITGILADGENKLLIATGTTVPTHGSNGYAKGCLFIDTDVATGTTGLNCNKGTSSSSFFTAITQA